jgi:tungstate transport system substrate-binding protein
VGVLSVLLLLLPAVVLFLSGCANADARSSRNIVLASTTSTQDSGLFDELLPAFERAYPEYVVRVIAVGTGEALKLGEEKAADVILVHAPDAEEEFVRRGLGTERREVMYNEFVLVGPADDPASVRRATGGADAFARVAAAEAVFVSRGDESGTHRREVTLWQEAALESLGVWYQSTGQGMGEVLRIASEKRAYTLTDLATFLTLEHQLDLEILFDGDESFFNQYGVIPVAGANNQAGAEALAAWLVSHEGQELIGSFGMERFGRPLFTPNGG